MKPKATIEITDVHVRNGETLTVFIEQGGKTDTWVQVELRARPDGVIQIFSDRPLSVQPFMEWSPI